MKKVKRPLVRTLFDRIGTIVKRYHLTADFLESMQSRPHDLPQTATDVPGAVKPELEAPLFVFCTAEEYRLVVELMRRFDNPYLPYANSPEEIALSEVLFTAKPNLDRELLMRHHFRKLLAGESGEPPPEDSMHGKPS